MTFLSCPNLSCCHFRLCSDLIIMFIYLFILLRCPCHVNVAEYIMLFLQCISMQHKCKHKAYGLVILNKTINVLFQIIRRTILSLTALLVLVLTANVYFVYVIVEERSPSIQTNKEVVVGTNVTKFEIIGCQEFTLCCQFLTIPYSTEIPSGQL